MPNEWMYIKWFQPVEFDSPDKLMSGYSMNIEFIVLLDAIRECIKIPLRISSGGGYRTIEYNNTQVKSPIKNSPHLRGIAADIICTDSESRYKIIKCALDKGITRLGIGFKRGFIHLDIDKNKDKAQNIIWGYND